MRRAICSRHSETVGVIDALNKFIVCIVQGVGPRTCAIDCELAMSITAIDGSLRNKGFAAIYIGHCQHATGCKDSITLGQSSFSSARNLSRIVGASD